MLRCNDCGAIFDEDAAKTYTEKEEFWGAPCYRTMMMCPECDGEDISDYDEDDEQEEEE